MTAGAAAPDAGPSGPGAGPDTLNEPWPVRRWAAGQTALTPAQDDLLAAEEPLELRAVWPPERGEAAGRPLAVLMRTPGADRELLRGWLHAEGLPFAGPGALGPHPENPNLWSLAAEIPADYTARHASSACGICGSGSLERLALRTPGLPPLPPADWPWLATLPDRLRAGQRGFSGSGGLHAAALFTPGAAAPLCLFEDIGRHNAADKAVGWLLERAASEDAPPEQRLPPAALTLVLSSRLGYEIAQKAVLAGIGTVVGVGGATTLAAQTAAVFGLRLCGFARGGHLTVYSGAE